MIFPAKKTFIKIEDFPLPSLMDPNGMSYHMVNPAEKKTTAEELKISE